MRVFEQGEVGWLRFIFVSVLLLTVYLSYYLSLQICDGNCECWLQKEKMAGLVSSNFSANQSLSSSQGGGQGVDRFSTSLRKLVRSFNSKWVGETD